MQPTTDALVGRVGVEVGHHCLDLGCGGGHVAIATGRMVGPTGRVVGIDFSGIFCEPPDWAHEAYARLYGDAVALSGGDAAIGRRLPLLVAESGLDRWR